MCPRKEKTQKIKKDWESDKDKDYKWANQGVIYAKSLRKNGSFSEAINVCEEILSEYPNFRKAINQCGWNLYSEFIKSSKYDRENTKKYEVANRIITMFRPMEPYTPYVMTCLSVVEWSLQEENFDSAINWLSKIDKNKLSKEELNYQSYGKEKYWSQARKYLELTALYLEGINKHEASIRVYFQIIRECSNSTGQMDEVNNHIVSNISSLYAVDNEDLIDLLLVKRGFQNKETRQAYKKVLQRRYQSYNYWDKEANSPVFSSDDGSIIRQLAKEILFASVPPTKNRTEKISATALSNFTFCPASYSLQKTYDFQDSNLGNIGTIMHDKQLLLSGKIKETKKEFYFYATKKKSSYFDSLFIDDNIRLSIADLMQDVSTANLIFHGHKNKERKIFYDESGTLVGSPDYIFKKPDGTIFVVEEKFSFHSPQAISIDKPHRNHRVQLGAYTTLLRDIKASYGYLLYWSYSFTDTNIPYVSKAQSFRVNNSTIFYTELTRLVNEVKELNDNGRMDFDIKTLNLWKCVNCVTTDHCNHKTGNTNTVTLPYI